MVLAVFAFPLEAKAPKTLDLVDAVAANRILTQLNSMIAASDLATFLSSKGPFTLFAPTDSAFAKLPPGTLDALLRPENKERLQHILLFHVVSGKKLYAKDLTTATDLFSCEGSPLPLKTTKSGIQFVAKAKITHADIRCQNGIIHQVDTVLMPLESSLPPLAPPAPPPSTNAPPSDLTDTNAPPSAPDASMPTSTNAPPLTPTPEVSPH